MDVPAILHEITMHALSHSNVVLLIANLFDLTTASDTMKLAAALEEENIPNECIQVVINRVS
jgi:Flp pilus assembly CpaE family ATPase